MFYVGGVYDQLNMPALASFEVAARRIQSIVDAYSQDPSKPSWASARLFAGLGNADDLVAPELRQFAARKAKEESDIESVRTRGKGLAAAAEAVAAGGLPHAEDEAKGGKSGGKGTKSKGQRSLPAASPA